jgi:hypothetical protein
VNTGSKRGGEFCLQGCHLLRDHIVGADVRSAIADRTDL